MEPKSRARQQRTGESELARAIFFLGGMHTPECPKEIRTRLSEVRGVVEVLVSNYIETPYGIAQVFYNSKEVGRDEVLSRLGPPYWATLIEDKDPQRELLLQRYTEVYVC